MSILCSKTIESNKSIYINYYLVARKQTYTDSFFSLSHRDSRHEVISILCKRCQISIQCSKSIKWTGVCKIRIIISIPTTISFNLTDKQNKSKSKGQSRKAKKQRRQAKKQTEAERAPAKANRTVQYCTRACAERRDERSSSDSNSDASWAHHRAKSEESERNWRESLVCVSRVRVHEIEPQRCVGESDGGSDASQRRRLVGVSLNIFAL